MTKDIEREAFEALPLAKLALSQDWVRYHKESNTYYPNEDFCPDSAPETMNFAWQAWQAAKAQANKQFENFIDQAIEDSACADERRSLQALLDEFHDIATIETQEPTND